MANLLRTSSAKYRNWVWTINNPSYEYVAGSDDFWNRFGGSLRYAIYQIERGGDTGTIHWQGYVEFDKPISGAALSKMLPSSYHSRRNGTRIQAREYCRKEESRIGGPFEKGDFGLEPGKRNDLLDVKQLIDDGKEEVVIWDECFVAMTKYFKGVEKYKSLRQPKRTQVTRWKVYVGKPGTGKTESVQKEYPTAYWKSADEWWDGYSGEDVVVLDEFHGWLPFHLLLRLGDGSPLPVQVKGSKVHFIATLVVIISNKEPSEWYAYQEKKLDFDAIKRRIGGISWTRKNQEPQEFSDYESFYEALLNAQGRYY